MPDFRLKVPFAKKDAVKQIARKAGGTLTWDPAKKEWIFTGKALPKDLEAYASATASKADPGKTKAEKTSAEPKGQKRFFALDVPFHARPIAASLGAKWDGEKKVHLWEGDVLPRELRYYKSAPFSWERWIEDTLNGEVSAHPDPDPKIKPRPHQEEAIQKILAARKAGRMGFLLADDVGLGKTISTIGAIQRMPEAKRILIICPIAVVPHWRRTVAALGLSGRRVVVINYERLDRLFKMDAESRSKVASKKKGKKKAVVRKGEAISFDVMVVDESHYCKNIQAARSKAVAALQAKTKFTLWLSATAGQNPLELSYLAPLLADVTGSRVSALKDFEAWCVSQGIGLRRGDFGKWIWDGNEEDCEKVRSMLFDGKVPAGLRRRPSSIAGWPEINRILFPITLDEQDLELYNAAWDEFREQLGLVRQSRDREHFLVAQLRFRQKASLIRIAGTVNLALDLLQNGHQVAISVSFIETLEKIKDALEAEGIPVAVIYGDMPATRKESERIAFQKGEKRVCLFTVVEGISLHQGEMNDVPRSEIIHDLRYSAIQMAQIEGRCHRDGKFAQMYWCYADETVEEKIAQTVAGRVSSMKGMVGDDRETIREIEKLLAA